MKSSELVANTIMAAAQRQGLGTPQALAVKTRLDPTTMRRKIKDPSKFTLHDIGLIDYVVKFRDEELRTIIRGRE